MPVDTIIGQYDLRGKALLVPVVAKGAINLTLGKSAAKLKYCFHKCCL